MNCLWLFLVFCLVLLASSVLCIEPISMTAGLVAGGSAALTYFGYNYDYIKVNTYCRYYECCLPEYIPADMSKFKEEMDKNLFGQHIASKIVTTALDHHFQNLNQSSKPLVMSFHGSAGIGKTFITNIMKNAIYKLGLDSKYVHTFNGRSNFPLEEKASQYREELIKTVKDAVYDCPLSLFVFDEVDKMPSTVFNGISSMLDTNYPQKDAHFNKAIYIFLSNTGGMEINQQLKILMDKGLTREDTELYHFEKLIESSVVKVPGALVSSGLAENAIIDHFIPFLPLEQRHLWKCIEREFHRAGITNPSKENVKEILTDVVYDDNVFFALHGCKKLEKKVGLLAHTIKNSMN